VPRCIGFCVQDMTESILSTRSTRRSVKLPPRMLTSAGIQGNSHVRCSYESRKLFLSKVCFWNSLSLHFPPLGNLKKKRSNFSTHASRLGSRDSRIRRVLGSRLQSRFRCNLSGSVIIITVVILSSFRAGVSRCSIPYANSNLGHLDSPSSTLGPRKF
jgi:hypothetical protein